MQSSRGADIFPCMSFDDFEKHLRYPAPGFQCSPAAHTFIVKVKHRLGTPATRAGLALLKKSLGPATDKTIARFYSKHDGALLYCQPGFDAVGIQFFPIAKWEAATRECSSRWTGDGLDDWGDPLPKPPGGIVFAEIPHSGNFFVLRVEGKQTGKIFYENHENSDSAKKPLCESFEALLDMISSDPAKFLSDRGSYTRYSDGKTGLQWIPTKFLPNAPKQFWT